MRLSLERGMGGSSTQGRKDPRWRKQQMHRPGVSCLSEFNEEIRVTTVQGVVAGRYADHIVLFVAAFSPSGQLAWPGKWWWRQEEMVSF